MKELYFSAQEITVCADPSDEGDKKREWAKIKIVCWGVVIQPKWKHFIKEGSSHLKKIYNFFVFAFWKDKARTSFFANQDHALKMFTCKVLLTMFLNLGVQMAEPREDLCIRSTI